jgi:hypothetical protein
MKPLKHVILMLAVIVIAGLLSGGLHQVLAADPYVANGSSENITGPDGVCQKITNNSATGMAIFVPHHSPQEWSDFQGHLQQGVTAQSCVLPCQNGYMYDGLCWLLSATNQSCDNACASNGGANIATVTVAGSGGTDAACQTVGANLITGPYQWNGPAGNAPPPKSYYGPPNHTRFPNLPIFNAATGPGCYVSAGASNSCVIPGDPFCNSGSSPPQLVRNAVWVTLTGYAAVAGNRRICACNNP